MIQETLGSVHLPTTFTENIMKQVANIKPALPTHSKPLYPSGTFCRNSHLYLSSA